MPPWKFGKSSQQPGGAETDSSQKTSPSWFETDEALIESLQRQEVARSDALPSSHLSSPKGQSHSRSKSQNLPSIFGSFRRKREPNSDDEVKSQSLPADALLVTDDVDDDFLYNAPAEDREFETGSCMTCASKVKWPRGIAEYRCTLCLTVNDIRPVRLRQPSPKCFKDPASDVPAASKIPVVDEMQISLERTMSIIDNCLDAYLKAQQTLKDIRMNNEREAAAVSTSSAVDSLSSIPNEALNVQEQSKAVQETAICPPPSRPAPTAPTDQRPSGVRLPVRRDLRRTPAPNPNSSQAPRQPDAIMNAKRPAHVSMFKPLETYISRFYGNLESLNTSFCATLMPRTSLRPKDSDTVATSKDPTDPPESSNTAMSDLDAKMLLIGDIGENSSWLSGNPRADETKLKLSRSKASSHYMVHSKSPNIAWDTVRCWYEVVVEVGARWRESHSSYRQELDEETSLRVDEEISEARAHVQSVLLKTTELLLKRPGRLLRRPDDTRFLLIILANPLLYPRSIPITRSVGSTQTVFRDLHIPVKQEIGSSDVVAKNKEPSRDHLRSSAWERGQAFGIIKRTLGLLSNLRYDCHRYLGSWLQRLEDSHFRQLVELIESFVTRRLGRQHAHRGPTRHNPAPDLIPALSSTTGETSAQLHAAIGLGATTNRNADGSLRIPPYCDDWQLQAAARVMALFFTANKHFYGNDQKPRQAGASAHTATNGAMRVPTGKKYQFLKISEFYNSMLDLSDMVADFEVWESKKAPFTWCQYPYFISMRAKTKILEYDARRQMTNKAREAFFNSLTQRSAALGQYFHIKVRRECLVEDSLKQISEVVGAGREDMKKQLRVQFEDEPGVDAGGLRKEFFLLLCRTIFDPQHGLFLYDEESNFCYFNPHCFETSDQYFLVGALLGLAIYNSTILDIAVPPFTFKRLLAGGPSTSSTQAHFNKGSLHLTLDDLAEYRPSLARGLRQLLEFDGDVQEIFCRDFVVDVERYGVISQVPLCPDGQSRPVTNANRQEFVDLYVRYVLETAVARQFEPFKRGFLTVCGGNALSLFQPEEIELLVRGSDEALDVPSLRAVATYQNWSKEFQTESDQPTKQVPLINWFWEFFQSARPADQRKILAFITGSDRIPAMGATSLVIRIHFAGHDATRYPIARTCFNQLMLFKYGSKSELEAKLWRAVCESEGFGLK